MNYIQMKNALSLTDNPMEKLDMLMDFGRGLEIVPEEAVCHEILGCSSFVEICVKDGHFYGRADSMLVRGIVAVIVAMVNQFSYREFDIEADLENLELAAAKERWSKKKIALVTGIAAGSAAVITGAVILLCRKNLLVRKAA